MELRYFRDVDKREVAFILIEDGRPLQFIECKSTGRQPAPGLRYLKKRFPAVRCTQISLRGDADLLTRDDIRLCPAHIFLDEFV